MDSIYIETSIVSHATAWPSSNPKIALLQQQARDWWRIERRKFRVVTSQLVLIYTPAVFLEDDEDDT